MYKFTRQFTSIEDLDKFYYNFEKPLTFLLKVVYEGHQHLDQHDGPYHDILPSHIWLLLVYFQAPLLLYKKISINVNIQEIFENIIY